MHYNSASAEHTQADSTVAKPFKGPAANLVCHYQTAKTSCIVHPY